MNRSKTNDEKCKSCYLLEGCILTNAMTLLCGGPWKDEKERTIFINKEILGIKTEAPEKD